MHGFALESHAFPYTWTHMPLSLDDGCSNAREHDGRRMHRLSRSGITEMHSCAVELPD